MVKLLQDVTSQGKPRKWGVRKAQSVAYAERLSEIYDMNPSVLARIEMCGDLLTFGFKPNGQKVLIGANFCHDRFCALCQWRRMLKMSYQVTKTVERAMINNPSGRFLFLTLTLRNCKGHELKTTITHINRSIRKLFMYRAINKNIIGYVKSLEVTVNREDNTYHPHAHLILQVKSTYFKDKSNYLSHLDWQKMWQKATKANYKPQVYIEVVKSRGGRDSINASVSEVAKYQTKATSYLSDDLESDVQIIKTLREQLRGNRMLSYGGLFNQYHKELFKREDESTEDLIHTNGEEEQLDVNAGRLVAKYNAQFHNYIIVGHDKPINHD